MKKFSGLGYSLLVVFAIVFVMFSCSKDEETKDTTATFNVKLTDAPAEYDAVNIDIQEVLIHYSDIANDTAEWKSLDGMQSGVYNLLELSNGLDTVLASAEIPTGTLSQIRLVLGDNNTLVIDGTSYDLETPASQQSGLKLNFGLQVVEGISYTVWLDFDAARSIVERGNGRYNLKPVIRAYTEAVDGGIKGVVKPDEAQPVVMAITGEDTVSTYSENGEYFINGLDAGTYSVVFSPIEGYQDTTILDVEVTLGAVAELDTVFLSQIK